MARNEEKHYGRLNRLYLLAEKKKYEKAHPTRPKLDSLDTVAEIQKWIPSIKQDIDFYLKKSQVTCYSDQHIEQCGEKIVKLEREFKAFVRKIKQLSQDPTDPIPWTSRAYKRKFSEDPEVKDKSEFEPIPCPILEQEKPKKSEPPIFSVNMDLMDKPLSFNKTVKESGILKDSIEAFQLECEPPLIKKSDELNHNNEIHIAHANMHRIVDYENSSDSDCS